MKRYEFAIAGKPVAQKRPRFARIGKGVRTYSTQKTEASKLLLETRLQKPKEFEILSGPVHLHIEFHMPIPKSTSKKNTALMKAGIIRHTKKPDLSNLLKFVEDVLNNELWLDDSQIFKIEMEKVYSEYPGTYFEFTEYDQP